MAHQRRCGRRRFLVQYKGFSPAYDEWKSEQDVSPQLIEEYDELWRLALTGVGTRDGDGEFPRSPGGEVEGGHQGRALPTRPITEAGPRCASGTPAEIGKKTERWHECDLVRKRVAVFFPDWTMNADGFISSMWIAFQVIGRRTVRRAHVTCHVNPKPVGFISLPYLPEGFWPDRNPSGEAERELRVGLYHSLVTAGC